MEEEKHTFQFEVALSVARYWDGGNMEDHQEAFDACQSDSDGALEVAQEELTEAGVTKALDNMDSMKIKVVKFVEFDSSNLSHAGGYFLIEMSGSKKDVTTVKKLHTKWVEG